MATNAELSKMIEKQRWTEKVVEETFDGVPDSNFNKRMAQMAIAQSRKHLEAAIDIHLSRDTSD
jgi:hypothetical protein